MSAHFRGEYPQRLDDKCRLAIPAAFRRVLVRLGQTGVVLVRSLRDGHVCVYPLDAWEARERIILAAPTSVKAVMTVRYAQVGSASEQEPDGHGRLLVPQGLRQHAGLSASSEVYVVGQVDHFTIWSAERWQKVLGGETILTPEEFEELARYGI
jgi:MraZ protein